LYCHGNRTDSNPPFSTIAAAHRKGSNLQFATITAAHFPLKRLLTIRYFPNFQKLFGNFESSGRCSFCTPPEKLACRSQFATIAEKRVIIYFPNLQKLLGIQVSSCFPHPQKSFACCSQFAIIATAPEKLDWYSPLVKPRHARTRYRLPNNAITVLESRLPKTLTFPPCHYRCRKSCMPFDSSPLK
jgi:hypothetical protein